MSHIKDLRVESVDIGELLLVFSSKNYVLMSLLVCGFEGVGMEAGRLGNCYKVFTG